MPNPLQLSPRTVFLLLAGLAFFSMAFAYFFLQQSLGLPPCPLCITQRVFVVAAGLVALAAVIHNPKGWGIRVYALLCAVMAGFGAAVAGRHVWLQSLPEDQAPACGPGLAYMFETFPLGEAIGLLLKGDGNCAETQWTFLGLSIPQQTLLLFIGLAILALWQLFRSPPRTSLR